MRHHVLAGLICLALFAGTGLSGCASAPQAHETQTPVSLAEFNQRVYASFQALDSNHDGLLEPEEYAKRPKWVGDAKKMPSGQVSIVDYVTAADARFEADKNLEGSRP
jgi:hypothetical protein